MDKTIYELDLHEFAMANKYMHVTRVAGGWLYESSEKGAPLTFVPYNKEFKPKKETTPKEVVKKSRPDNIFQVYFQFIINGLLPTDAWRKANDFMTHYDACGWKVGSRSMINWKSAVDGTWTKEYAVLSKFHRDNMKAVVEKLTLLYRDVDDYIEEDVPMIKKTFPDLFQAYKLPDSWLKYCGEK